MTRPSILAALLSLLFAGPAALAQGTDAPVSTSPPPAPASTPAAEPPPPAAPPIQAAPLEAPDLFSAGAGPTGLPGDLWRGASADLAAKVIPLLSQKPLSPAAEAFAHRLMSTGARAPEGAGDDADLAAARINAVLSLGDAAGARSMLDHTAGVRASSALSQVSAEADLVAGQDDQACAVEQALTQAKDGPYWRRLRAFCLLRAGDAAAAQLAYDLAESQAKDETYKRLMSAAVSGAPPGQASLRNGLEFALSRRLMLDLAPALSSAWAPILKTLAAAPDAAIALKAAAAAPINDMARSDTLQGAVREAALSVAAGNVEAAVAKRLVEQGAGGDAAAQAASALYAALGAPADAKSRADFAQFDLGRSAVSQSRRLELEGVSGGGGARGDVALLALWIAADAGAAGLGAVDRAAVVRTLSRAGFIEDARAYALEGLLALQPAPPAVAKTPAPSPKATPNKASGHKKGRR